MNLTIYTASPVVEKAVRKIGLRYVPGHSGKFSSDVQEKAFNRIMNYLNCLWLDEEVGSKDELVDILVRLLAMSKDDIEEIMGGSHFPSQHLPHNEDTRKKLASYARFVRKCVSGNRDRVLNVLATQYGLNAT